MPAEVKRAADGIYLLFLAENVNGDEISYAVNRYQQDATHSGFERFVLVVDPIQLSNPLRVVRLFTQQIENASGHYIVVNNHRSGAVIAERLAQKLPDATVEVQPHQRAAIERAKQLMGLSDEDEVTACDYL